LKNPIEPEVKKAVTETHEGVINLELCQKLLRNCDFEQLTAIIQKDPKLESTINPLLKKYYLFATTELIEWIGKFNQMKIFFNTRINSNIQDTMTHQELIQVINENIALGQKLGQEIVEYMKPIYHSIRLLLDQGLPEKSVAIGYAEKTIQEKKTPWVAIEALYFALNNWRRQYGKETENIYRSLLVPLSDVHRQILINDYASLEPEVQVTLQKFLEGSVYFENFAKRCLDKINIEISELNVLESEILEFFTTFNLLLTILHDRLVSENSAIDQLNVIKNGEKDEKLLGNLGRARKKIETRSNYSITQNLTILSKGILQVNQALDVLLAYYRKKEFLLNYPNAIIAIEECLKRKNEVTPQDLPVSSEFAEEYLKMYRSEKQKL
jgi:hypothetical protein